MYQLIAAGLVTILLIILENKTGLCQASPCDSPWQHHGNRCFKLHDTAVSFPNAKSKCEDQQHGENAKLAYSSSSEEDAFLSGLIPPAANDSLWLGTEFSENIANWTNSDGREATYFNWAVPEPKVCRGSADWKPVTNSSNKCYLFNETPVKWDDAKTACRQIGGHIAVINKNTEEEAFFIAETPNQAKYWAAEYEGSTDDYTAALHNWEVLRWVKNTLGPTSTLGYICSQHVECVALINSTKKWKRFNCDSKTMFACYQDIPAAPELRSDPVRPAQGDRVELTCNPRSGDVIVGYTFYRNSSQVQDEPSNTYVIDSVANGVYTCLASRSAHVHSEQSAPWSIFDLPPENITTSSDNTKTTEGEEMEDTVVVVVVVVVCLVLMVAGGVAAYWIIVVIRRKKGKVELEQEKEGDEKEEDEPEEPMAPTVDDRSMFQQFKETIGFGSSKVDVAKTESGMLSNAWSQMTGSKSTTNTHISDVSDAVSGVERVQSKESVI